MKLDVKSVIIGVLSTLLIFLILGLNPDKNLGDITVNSLTMKNSRGDILGEIGYSDKDSISFIRLYGHDKKPTTNIYSSDMGGQIFLKGYDKSSLGLIGIGVVQVKNADERVVATFGNDIITSSSRLQLRTNNNKGGLDLYSINDDVFFSLIDETGNPRTKLIYESEQKKSSILLFNSKNNLIMAISENKQGDGQMVLSDRYGDLGWGVDGKRK
jgi:hypothetical protein